MSVDSRLVAQHRDISQRQALHLQVPAARADQHPSRQQQVARLRFLTRDGADFVQPPGKHFGKAFRHVLHHHNGAGKIRRQLREHVLQGLRPSGGNADGDHPGRSFLGIERGFLSRTRSCAHRPDGHAPALGRGFDLADQFGCDLRHAGGDITRLGHEIKRAQRQGFQRDEAPCVLCELTTITGSGGGA